MRTSDTIKHITTALIAVQGEIGNVAKTATNPHLKSKYADLTGIIETCRPVLNKHGLAYTHGMAESDGTFVTVVCRLLHPSGEWLESSITLRPVKVDPQGIGSAVTYGKRYTLAAIVGLATEDDDGHGANVRDDRPPPTRATAREVKPDTLSKSMIVGAIVEGWGVQKEDVSSVLGTIKQRLNIVGEAKASDYARILGEIRALVAANVSINNIGSAKLGAGE